MKILIAPLNWGLGHASRCVPLVRRYLAAGDEVLIGGDGESLVLLRKMFPHLKVVRLAPLNLRYSAGRSQVGAMLRAIPRIMMSAIRDHRQLRRIVREESIDMVVSDNRFGLWFSGVKCVYMTHQLVVALPAHLRRWEGVAARLHAWVYGHYDEVWIPDREEDGLSGRLSHNAHARDVRTHIKYIGVLSRFDVLMEQGAPSQKEEVSPMYDVVAVLSGLEPQRSILEREIVDRYAGQQERVLVVRGRMNEPNVSYTHGNIRFANHMSDEVLAHVLWSAKRIIVRSGFSTIMDLATLGVLDKAEWHPTPGQPEQEYLAEILSGSAIQTNL